MTTHADLLAAIDKARRNPEEWDGLMEGGWSVAAAHNAQLDLCRAILDLHQPTGSGEDYGYCDGCFNGCDWDTCPTMQAVADALTRMGAL